MPFRLTGLTGDIPQMCTAHVNIPAHTPVMLFIHTQSKNRKKKVLFFDMLKLKYVQEKSMKASRHGFAACFSPPLIQLDMTAAHF